MPNRLSLGDYDFLRERGDGSNGKIAVIGLTKQRAVNAQYSLSTASGIAFAYSTEWVDGQVLLRMRSLGFPLAWRSV